MRNRIKFVTLVCVFVLISMNAGHAGISLGGTSGLVNIPTADVLEDRQITVGLGIVNRHSAWLQQDVCDNVPFHIVIGYLPRLEFSAGVTFVPGRASYDGTNTYKDGIISLQYLLFRETRLTPDIAIGVRDVYSYILLNTSYCVMSKTIVRHPSSSLRFHIGYGSDMIDSHIQVADCDKDKPVGHTIVGTFGGLELNYHNFITFMLEYDTKRINSGVRVRINSSLYFDIDMLNMEDLSGSMNVSFRL